MKQNRRGGTLHTTLQDRSHTSLHEGVEERRADEVEDVAEELSRDVWMDPAVREQRPGLVQNPQHLPDLRRNTQTPGSRPRTSGEGVAVQKSRQDGVKELGGRRKKNMKDLRPPRSFHQPLLLPRQPRLCSNRNPPPPPFHLYSHQGRCQPQTHIPLNPARPWIRARRCCWKTC